MARKRPKKKELRPALILCGAEQRLQIVLAQDGEPLAAETLDVQGSAQQHMAPAIESLLARLGITSADLTGIAVVRGPGSFTGLRMAMAMALGIARAANLPMAGLDYLPLLAASPAPLLTGTLAVVTHSRSKQVYYQSFTMPDATPQAEPIPLSVQEAADAINALPAPRTVLGSGLRNNREFFEEALTGTTLTDDRFEYPHPHVLAQAARDADFSHDAPTPLYLRASDAEDNLNAIATARGVDPKAAREQLDQATTTLASPGEEC